MRLLLDTHVWIWSQQDPERLGTRARRLLVGPQHENHVCAVSTLELARLVGGGAVSVSLTLREWVEQALRALRIRTVEVSHEIAIEAYALPEPFHKDPADRLLVAAARTLDLTVLTADQRILAYGDVRSKDARE